MFDLASEPGFCALSLMKNLLKTAALLALALALVPMPARLARAEADDQYTFEVHNAYKEKIVRLMASEDGKEYAKFDIGKGIEPGETVTLNWNKSTNNSNCDWFIKAVYADDTMSEPAEVDFCEEDLVIDF